ncbi:probable cytochrome P450 301a1, mitochondrial isoform X1 [Vespula pensylvanica]|uniref:Cytochrome P450 n=2 Tax=Vespula pensylvanica TaxID=30213 RepID=A0A834NQ34_VESPE|nr:probable cytochrome P450 301a1, mitochondrial isoform X1 [Vespula pensylvanica]KAF7415488.1 hypothetical protein H0235_012080 [Vespula pensylvanica]
MMCRVLSPSAIVLRFYPFCMNGNTCRGITKFPVLSNVENQRCIDINTNEVISTRMAQSHAASAVSETLNRDDTLPLMESTSAEVMSETFEIPSKFLRPTIEDRAPLSFDQIPGPMIMKLWEKYWKYVPIFGTQLFSSLLNNRFSQGRLSWNRNITPVKYLFNRYGCIVRLSGPLSGDIVMIHRPEHIEEVFKQEGNTPIRSGIDVLEHYRLHYRKYRLAGAFSMQSSEWLELKEKVHKPFNKIDPKFFRKLEIVSEDFIGQIRKIRNRQDEVPDNFNEDIARWGSECFFTLIFDKKLGFLDSTGQNPTSEPAIFIDALTTAHKYLSRCETGFQVWRFFDTPFSKRLFSACDVIDGIIGKYIRQAQNMFRTRSPLSCSEETSSVLEKLLLAQRLHPDDVSTLLMDMAILGVQAMTSCEAFLLYFLAKSPRVQKKLYEEIVSVIPNAESSITETNLQDMPYLKACLKESLRLRPAFPYITRLLPNSICLHGYTVPKGTFVIMASQITSQREENFEDPEKFRPERWLTNRVDDDFQEYSYLPFGHGARSCLGRHMAEIKMALLTAKLVREFKIEYNYADIGTSFYMMNVPDKPLRFRFIDRD